MHMHLISSHSLLLRTKSARHHKADSASPRDSRLFQSEDALGFSSSVASVAVEAPVFCSHSGWERTFDVVDLDFSTRVDSREISFEYLNVTFRSRNTSGKFRHAARLSPLDLTHHPCRATRRESQSLFGSTRPVRSRRTPNDRMRHRGPCTFVSATGKLARHWLGARIRQVLHSRSKLSCPHGDQSSQRCDPASVDRTLRGGTNDGELGTKQEENSPRSFRSALRVRLVPWSVRTAAVEGSWSQIPPRLRRLRAPKFTFRTSRRDLLIPTSAFPAFCPGTPRHSSDQTTAFDMKSDTFHTSVCFSVTSPCSH
ncbi:hypothetical protein PHSY_001011 [Pseudozyma hubeiensis SY62]|uniref:Uncharacterized protein n=1 Tax=Pseudozyma hubeiensis (strain SY62) TaxID=1305764 RepID=R9NXV8_PSEHS|nr:hypothetical protein PHSY_001011 [Pseudozyma hubeiensis SY62]GAC93446.1 hypothetical protein PHSY_001011 [Pseudozyma hubeiensis SY62]